MQNIDFNQESKSVIELVSRLATDQIEPDDPIYIPSLQREFCWDDEQIEELFDSLLRELPISSFLLWDVDGNIAAEEATYLFIENYAEKSSYPTEAKYNKDGVWVRNKSRKLSDSSVPTSYTFALDGQQRLTSFLIGLLGTYYGYKSRHWQNKISSYSERRLCLDILSDPTEELEIDEDLRYKFDFKRGGGNRTDTGSYWWPVPRLLKVSNIESEISELQSNVAESDTEEQAIESNLSRLYSAIFEEEHLVIEKVSSMSDKIALELFVRRNSGGQPLSNSDIAFSQMAVYWESEKEDPKEAIESYTNELEDKFNGYGFSYGKGSIIRSLLMLTGELPPSFRRENLVAKNIKSLEDIWTEPAYKQSMSEALRLVTEEIGYAKSCLTSNNAVLPIALYCFERLRETGETQVSPPEVDLDRMEYWLNLTVVSNLFSIGSDTVLKRAQNQIGAESFPVIEIVEGFRGRGIQIELNQERLVELVQEASYGGGSTTHLLLTKSYTDGRISQTPINIGESDGSASENQLQLDHIFPRNKLKNDEALMDELGFTTEDVNNRNNLANLQLIPDNQVKGDKDPDVWLRERIDDGYSMAELMETHCLPWSDPDKYSYDRFGKFIQDREKLLVNRLMDQMILLKNVT